ncbi:MAG TPA: Wzt carbohydrate-binding domain-containing protein, partial [Actinomycetota bacterium]|nr:Wzt carbohydrate-binding domain-containing protein [Actinomycetota bacterium]
DTAVLLDRGKVEASGDVDDVVREFRLRMLARQGALSHPQVTGHVEITGVQLLDATGSPAERLAPGDPMLVQVETRMNRAIDDAIVSVSILDAAEQLVHETDTGLAGASLRGKDGDKQRVRFDLRTLPLNAGRYFVTVGVRPRDRSVLHDFHDRRYWFEISRGNETRGRLFIPTDVQVESL